MQDCAGHDSPDENSNIEDAIIGLSLSEDKESRIVDETKINWTGAPGETLKL